jgi:hypothetical protein
VSQYKDGISVLRQWLTLLYWTSAGSLTRVLREACVRMFVEGYIVCTNH